MRPKKSAVVFGKRSFLDEIERLLGPLEIACVPGDARAGLKAANLVVVDGDPPGGYRSLPGAFGRARKNVLWVSSRDDLRSIARAIQGGASDYVLRPYNIREFITRVNAALDQKTKISCIGGGTGLFSLLVGLKTLPHVLLSAIVGMTDDGGSSGRLRASFGILPPGDVRRSLVALSNAPELMNEVLQYRFEKGGGLSGHSFGNLFLTALASITGTMNEAVRGLGDILNIQGRVIPATLTPSTLAAKFEGGKVVRGESKIDLAQERQPNLHIKRIWQEPAPACNPNAYEAVLSSDFLVIGPGDLYTSVLTSLVVKNLRQAILSSRAKKIYICNLMTKPGETAHYDAARHIEEITRYLGKDVLDVVIVSNTKLSHRARYEYSKMNQAPVETSAPERIRRWTRAKIVLADVGHEEELVRHDSTKLRNEIFKIIRGK